MKIVVQKSIWIFSLFAAATGLIAGTCIENLLSHLQDHRVIFIADRHNDDGAKKLLNASFGKFYDKGVTHLALEMFDPLSQPVLQSYFRRSASDEELRSELTRFWSWNPDAYVQVARTARDSSIQLVGIDAREKMILAPIQPIQSSLHERDIYMASQISQLLSRSPTTRVVVLVGRHHVVALAGSENLYLPNTPRLPELLFKNYGIGSASYFISGDGEEKAFEWISSFP